MVDSIDNSMDVIDSRDIIARLAELEDMDIEDMTEDEREESAALAALRDQCEGYGDWEYGEALIRASYFPEYVEELANDIGAVSTLGKNDNWWIVIDWEATARNVQQDYMTVDFGGVEYLMRA